LVTARSQAALTGVTKLLLLVAELVAETAEVAVIDGTIAMDATFTTTMMSTEAPEARLGSVQVTVAVIVQDQPAGAEAETMVVLGIDSVKLTAEAAEAPLFVTVSV
jgi:hypothetical protein